MIYKGGQGINGVCGATPAVIILQKVRVAVFPRDGWGSRCDVSLVLAQSDASQESAKADCEWPVGAARQAVASEAGERRPQTRRCFA